MSSKSRMPAHPHHGIAQQSASLSSALASPWSAQGLCGQRFFAARARSYYEALGVTASATTKDIKLAYLKEARKWHPDVNSSPEAPARFKQLANAYYALSDPSRRTAYDAGGPSNESGAPRPTPDVDAFGLFRAVLEEMGIEGVEDYWKHVKMDASIAAAKARQGDFQPARNFAKQYPGLIVSAVALALLLRQPAAVVFALRFVALVSYGIVNICFRLIAGLAQLSPLLANLFGQVFGRVFINIFFNGLGSRISSLRMLVRRARQRAQTYKDETRRRQQDEAKAKEKATSGSTASAASAGPSAFSCIGSLCGRRVIIQNMKKAELNNRTGTATSYEEAAGKYIVELDGGGSVRLKTINLREEALQPLVENSR